MLVDTAHGDDAAVRHRDAAERAAAADAMAAAMAAAEEAAATAQDEATAAAAELTAADEAHAAAAMVLASERDESRSAREKAEAELGETQEAFRVFVAAQKESAGDLEREREQAKVTNNQGILS